MKIVGLQINNVLRVEQVDITPDGTLQVIGGNNAQGKSSVLNAIWLALGGRDASKEIARPVREGADGATVRIDLGDMVVERTWKGEDTKLVVRSKDGATFTSPQTKLNQLVGHLGFDPLEFARMDSAKQRATLLGMVELDVDLDALEAERQELYERRRQFGQLRKAMGDIPVVADGAPLKVQSAAVLLAEAKAAADHNRAVAERHSDAQHDYRLRDDLVEQLRELESRLGSVNNALAEYEAWCDTAEATPEDVDALHERVASLEAANAAARANREALDKQAEADALDVEYGECKRQIAAIDTAKGEALAAAAFPVDGLGFDEHGVTFNGVPFAQASSAEQVRVSAAMGMALNPDLRVMMIRDGSLLDANTLAALREQVAANDFQVFIERVGEGDEGAIVIEDGRVKQ